MSFSRLLATACVGILVVPWSPPRAAQAGGPTRVEVAGEAAFASGTLDGLSLGADGVLRPGLRFEATALDAPSAWAGVRSGPALWIGCGDEARLMRVADGKAPERVDLGEGLMVTALAPAPQEGVVAAVFPGARLVAVDAAGATRALATLEAEHVWALLPGQDGSWIAATGVPGALWRVTADGATTKLVDVDDEHARCLAGRDGDLLIGTGGKGRVLAYDGTRLRVLRDLAQDEVVGIVRLADGSLVIAANADAGSGNAQQLAGLLKQLAQPNATRGEGKASERAALQDGVLLHLEAGGAVTTLWEAKKVALLALAPEGDGVVAGTYPAGRVLRAVPGRRAEVLADLPEAEASVLVAGPKGLEAVVTSNPAVLHRRGDAAAEGRFTSAPLETRGVARWGALEVVGRGVSAARYRSGETETPDATWTGWEPVAAFTGAAGAGHAKARYLQVELTLAGADAELRSLAVVAQPPNHAPTLSAFTFGAPKAKGEEAAATAKREVGWKVEDPDGDDLLTSVDVQRVGASRWASVVKDQALAKPGATWDTTGLPDGLYLVRITVSDAPANPVERARSAVLLAPPQRVDNTAPEVEAQALVSGDRLVLSGRAIDPREGRVAEVRVAIDGGPWQALSPADGLLDGSTEAFASSLPLPAAGDHDLVVQALDADGNVGAVGVTVTVPAPR